MKNKAKASIERILFAILILSVLELVVYVVLEAELSQCYSSVSNKYSFVLDMVNDLSLAYIMSYIFYVVVLIPERRKQTSINKYVGIYLNGIVTNLDSILKVSNSFKSDDAPSLSNSPNTTSIIRETGELSFMTYREHFVYFYKLFYDEYDHLSHYIAFIDDDLRDCLYQLVTSKYLVRINDFLISPKTSNYDEVFTKLYDDTDISNIYDKLKEFIGRG